jgi:endonuclease-3
MAGLKAPGWREIKKLIRHYGVAKFDQMRDPFEVLIGTILSQNTNDLNSRRAFESLSLKVGVTPRALAEADVGVISDSIRTGGLYNIKSARIKEVSKSLLRRHPDGLGFLRQLADEDVRNALAGLKGVGPKTIDIILAFSLGRDVVPVDTHVSRVSKRMGYVEPKAKYEQIRASLEKVIPKGMRVRGHIALIAHGRTVCIAGHPRCAECPVSMRCHYYRTSYVQSRRGK